MSARPTIYFISPDPQNPIGGVRKLYKQVDILNQHGYPAFIVHGRPGFRCAWFENQTPIIDAATFRPAGEDIIVIPEVFAERMATLGYPNRVVIFNQNAYYTFNNVSPKSVRTNSIYDGEQLAGVICVSRDNVEYLRYAFPSAKLYQIVMSVDSSKFFPCPNHLKKKQICYMPRKNAEELNTLLGLLGRRGAIDDFSVVPIQNMSEDEVAATLRDSLIFVASGYPEGLSLPPMEAMACGCITIGYHGFGGREYFTDDVAFPVPAADTLAFAKTVESVVARWRGDPSAFVELTRRASARIHENYSEQREVESILAAWRDILA